VTQREDARPAAFADVQEGPHARRCPRRPRVPNGASPSVLRKRGAHGLAPSQRWYQPVGQQPGRRRPGLADEFTDLIYKKVKATDGRITAKRLLPVAWVAGGLYGVGAHVASCGRFRPDFARRPTPSRRKPWRLWSAKRSRT
jgi:hypothetical protein